MPVDTTLEKPLPNNLDAERSVLGAILLTHSRRNRLPVHVQSHKSDTLAHDRLLSYVALRYGCSSIAA